MDSEKELVHFCAAMIDIAEERFSASCADEEADAFRKSDRLRHAGWDPIRIVEGPNSFR